MAVTIALPINVRADNELPNELFTLTGSENPNYQDILGLVEALVNWDTITTVLETFVAQEIQVFVDGGSHQYDDGYTATVEYEKGGINYQDKYLISVNNGIVETEIISHAVLA